MRVSVCVRCLVSVEKEGRSWVVGEVQCWVVSLRGDFNAEGAELAEKKGEGNDSRGFPKPNISNHSMDLDNCQGIL